MVGESVPSDAEWAEADSQHFIDFGKYFVPRRELQIGTICDLTPAKDGEFAVLELGCGEGLLAEAILQRYPFCTVRGLDGSATMRERATRRLAPFGKRFEVAPFDLAADDWRAGEASYRAIVSSLCVHHLDGAQKQAIYADLWRMLEPGGALIIADIVAPVDSKSNMLAARQWDEAVRERAMALDGDLGAWRQFNDDRWNTFRYPDPMDRPSSIFEHLQWLDAAGYVEADVYWMFAGHAIYGARRD